MRTIAHCHPSLEGCKGAIHALVTAEVARLDRSRTRIAEARAEVVLREPEEMHLYVILPVGRVDTLALLIERADEVDAEPMYAELDRIGNRLREIVSALCRSP